MAMRDRVDDVAKKIHSIQTNASNVRPGATLEQSLQWYRRLIRVPVSQRTRRNYLTARENQRSGLPILREGLKHSGMFEYLMTQVARFGPISVMDMVTDEADYKSLASMMSRLINVLQRYDMPWLARTRKNGPSGGRTFVYTLTPCGHAVMHASIEGTDIDTAAARRH